MQWWMGGVSSFHLRGIKRLRSHLAAGVVIKSNERFLSSDKSCDKSFIVELHSKFSSLKSLS
jgi:hypothetical protein